MKENNDKSIAKKKCEFCQNNQKEDAACKNKKNCKGFDFSKCEEYLIDEKMVMF